TMDGFRVPQLRTKKNERYPPDHLWLDLFWTPVVEPYMVSLPFSTDGKVNLNYEMMPFNYIKRATALHAVLKSERILALKRRDAGTYKAHPGDGRLLAGRHHRIDATETLKQFEERFARGEIFKTGSAICENFLIPEGERWNANGQAIRKFWYEHGLTGDNSLEEPYKNIYPRVTTQSNVFKVHMTVQSLKKVRSTNPNAFVSGVDQITSEYRGSAIIERYINPDDRDIPNYIKDHKHAEPRMDYYYRFRVKNVQQFAP
ncbi:MAG: Verru/Chthon cassette protein A, partial [Verrucomicrobiota bacterium]